MSEVLLRSVEWDAHSTQLNVKDKVSVRNLQVTVNSGLDVWGRQKIQRALISVTLSLAQTLASAASADSLDSSTVDYGKLSKDIRANVQETVWLPPYDLAELIKARVYEVAKGPIAQEQATVQSVEIDICYPKGSMFGDGAGLSWSFMMAKSLQMEQEFAPMPQSRVLYLRNVRVPCLVGINANEREQKQPVVVSLWIERLPKHLSDAHSSLESVIVDAISTSSFETLEALSVMAVQQLQNALSPKLTDGLALIRLRVEKPVAVPFADAPAVEIVRPARV